MNVDFEENSLSSLLSVPGRDPSIVLEAIRKGACVNESSDRGFTPLMYAVLLNDDPSIIRALIEAGADVDTETREGMTALAWAMQAETRDPDGLTGDSLRNFIERDRRRLAAAALLIQNGAGVDVPCCAPLWMKWTPLLFATLEPDRNAGVIAMMLKAGANANARTMEDITPLFHAAAFAYSSEVVRDLILAGADVGATGKQEGREGWTPLLYALTGPCRSLSVIEELLKRGAPVDTVVGDGQTPLFFAIAPGDDPRYVHALLEAGADVHSRNAAGSSVLDCAVARNHKNVINRLLKAGAA